MHVPRSQNRIEYSTSVGISVSRDLMQAEAPHLSSSLKRAIISGICGSAAVGVVDFGFHAKCTYVPNMVATITEKLKALPTASAVLPSAVVAVRTDVGVVVDKKAVVAALWNKQEQACKAMR